MSSVSEILQFISKLKIQQNFSIVNDEDPKKKIASLCLQFMDTQRRNLDKIEKSINAFAKDVEKSVLEGRKIGPLPHENLEQDDLISSENLAIELMKYISIEDTSLLMKILEDTVVSATKTKQESIKSAIDMKMTVAHLRE